MARRPRPHPKFPVIPDSYVIPCIPGHRATGADTVLHIVSKSAKIAKLAAGHIPRNMHIGIAGNIGSGKTTLTRMLADHYGWTPKYEAVTYNPYLEDYYKDIPRWSFNLEVYFLTQRFRDILEISSSEDVVIQDRTILEGVQIFVANNYEMGNLTERDYKTYMDLFNLMMSLVKAPDLLIYLKSSIPHLVAQIQKRGRDYEKSISLEYLAGLNEKYEAWISGYKGQVLTIDTDNLDFENNPGDFSAITDSIDARLYGLFPDTGAL